MNRGAATEDSLRDHAENLIAAIDNVFVSWIERLIVDRLEQSGMSVSEDLLDRARAAGQSAHSEFMPEISRLLETDVDIQTTTPMAILRRAVAIPTAVLKEAGAEPVERDEYSMRMFPDDIYGLTPANLGDVDPSLVDPGVTWGAAKAFVHLERHHH